MAHKLWAAHLEDTGLTTRDTCGRVAPSVQPALLGTEGTAGLSLHLAALPCLKRPNTQDSPTQKALQFTRGHTHTHEFRLTRTSPPFSGAGVLAGASPLHWTHVQQLHMRPNNFLMDVASDRTGHMCPHLWKTGPGKIEAPSKQATWQTSSTGHHHVPPLYSARGRAMVQGQWGGEQATSEGLKLDSILPRH